MKLKFKEIVKEHWEMVVDFLGEIYYAFEEFAFEIIPEFFSLIFEVIIQDGMRCLNVAGKIIAFPFLVVIYIIMSNKKTQNKDSNESINSMSNNSINNIEYVYYIIF